MWNEVMHELMWYSIEPLVRRDGMRLGIMVLVVLLDILEIVNFLDPLKLSKLFCKTYKERVFMQSIEIFNARVAMLAVVGYAVQEYVTGDFKLLICLTISYVPLYKGLPIIQESPEFFKSIF